MVDGSTCSLVWERRTTCWVTMRVPDPNILVFRRPLPVREGWDLDHLVSACNEGARACWGGGVLGLLSVRPHFSWGGGGRGSKRPAPRFPGPQGEPAHGLHPRFVVAEIWADRGLWGGGGGGTMCVFKFRLVPGPEYVCVTIRLPPINRRRASSCSIIEATPRGTMGRLSTTECTYLPTYLP